jgi:hypothetical protein
MEKLFKVRQVCDGLMFMVGCDVLCGFKLAINIPLINENELRVVGTWIIEVNSIYLENK